MSKYGWILIYLIVICFIYFLTVCSVTNILHPSPVFSCATHNGVKKIEGPVKKFENGSNFYYVTECNDGAVNWH